MFRKLFWLAAGVLLAALGCEGSSEIDGFGGNTSGTGGSTGGTGGLGGEDGGSGGSGGATSSGQGGSAGGLICGGVNDVPCGQDEFCDLPEGAECDAEGSCAPRPEGCPEDCPGVCGCDQQFYCNSCIANAAGVEVSTDTSCLPEPSSYAAQAWPDGLDHIIIMKQNDTAGRCLRIIADAPTTSFYNVTIPQPWGVNVIMAYHSTTNCLDGNQQPTGTPESAASATGSVSFTVSPNHIYPCQLNVNVIATFDNPPGWLESNVSVQATNIAVAGCY